VDSDSSSTTAAGNSTSIQVAGIVRRLGGNTVLDGVTFSIRSGEFFSLLGPSGCGKTTLLRIIGGLDLPDEGNVRVCGRDVRDFASHERPVNMVFQSYALFPHLSVRENVAFGLRMKKILAADIDRRVEKVLATVQITPLADRKPAQLSGGQKQRVAIARAIVNEPQVLLLDEPLGALDLKLRKELQIELLNLQRQLGITFVFVTHDQEEALVLSDRIAVMRAGRIEQMGGAEELYERPRKRFVAQFLGSCNLLEATVKSRSGSDAFVQTEVGELRVEVKGPLTRPAGTLSPSEGQRDGMRGPSLQHRELRVGDTVAVAIRPEKIQLLPAGASAGENRVKAHVEQLIYSGSETQYLLRSGETQLKAKVLNAKAAGQGFEIGKEVAVELAAPELVVLED
jgi:spermidine/putrescine transport system ATP-binding protein